MTEYAKPLPPVCEEDIHRFLFSSSAHFVGGTVNPAFHLTVAFPSFQSSHRMAYGNPSPTRLSFFSLSIRVPVEEPEGNFQVIETYSWMPERVCVLLAAFFGKFIRTHGHIQKGYSIMVPDIVVPHIPSFGTPPFNDKPRKPDGHELNLKEAKELVEGYLFADDQDTVLPKILSASTFYHLALENWSTNPIVAYISLVSSVEAILELADYCDSDLFDEQRLKDFSAISASIPDGDKVVSRFKSSLFSVNRKFVRFIETRLPEKFFEDRECAEMFFLKPEDLRRALKAAYEIRSKYLHTGDKMGFTHLIQPYENSEKVIGTPVLPDKDRVKLLARAPTLAGLERIVATLLRSEIGRWLEETRFPDSEEGSASENAKYPTAEIQPMVLQKTDDANPSEEVLRIF